MASNHQIVPIGLIEHLRVSFPMLKNLSISEQFRLAWMAWQGQHEFRQHSLHQDALWFHHTELYKWFGKGKFETLNSAVGMFQLSSNWSALRNETRAFWVSSELQGSMENFMSCMTSSVTGVQREDGKQVRKVPNPLRSTSSVTWHQQVAPSCISSTGVNQVWVNCELLLSLSRALGQILKSSLTQGVVAPLDGEGWMYPRPRKDLVNVKVFADKLRMLAKSPYGGEDVVVHVYTECAGGRVYASGLNLQNAPRVIKSYALADHWEYDIQNCHFSIIEQMSERSGYRCDAIRHYLAHKSQIRHHLADQVGIKVHQVKKCLLALMYGARPLLIKSCAIPKEIGIGRAKLLYAAPEFAGLANDLKMASKLIVEKATGCGSHLPKNAFGKTLQGKFTAAQILAHMTQGVERCALEAAISTCTGHVVLLQHDALVSRRQLDPRQIEAEILRQTGYRLEISETYIQPRLHQYLQNQ